MNARPVGHQRGTMKAVGYFHSLPITKSESLVDLELPMPEASGRDLLVRVEAISVNPVDTKVRIRATPDNGEPRILGWDAVGTVEAVGDKVAGFSPGDRVYYAGAIDRPGSNSEFQLVDERIAALAPRSLSVAEAAALPLTTITAYELLFDRLRVPKHGGAGQTLLVIGGAGGVGSALIQLARTLTKLHVIATASREESKRWCLQLGAHQVIDHTMSLKQQLATDPQVDVIASLTQSEQHFGELVEIIKPQGQIGMIDDLPFLDATKLKPKSVSLHWEMMFARSLYHTPDMHKQGELLAEVAALIDAGAIKTTLSRRSGPINAANLRDAHAALETGKVTGKIVLEGWPR